MKRLQGATQVSTPNATGGELEIRLGCALVERTKKLHRETALFDFARVTILNYPTQELKGRSSQAACPGQM
jgi:hypothetical protein